MKVSIKEDGLYLVFDLSDENQEVADYVLDQLNDRIDEELKELVIEEMDIDREKRTVVVTNVIADAVQRIIEEKQADMDFEEKNA